MTMHVPVLNIIIKHVPRNGKESGCQKTGTQFLLQLLFAATPTRAHMKGTGFKPKTQAAILRHWYVAAYLNGMCFVLLHPAGETTGGHPK
ncbi:MAG TPA: hypothetical protein VEZ17_06945 [Chitinophagaceae bacterium]|nr:hypothetical protein [Chitinophagaceae bacterium]